MKKIKTMCHTMVMSWKCEIAKLTLSSLEMAFFSLGSSSSAFNSGRFGCRGSQAATRQAMVTLRAMQSPQIHKKFTTCCMTWTRRPTRKLRRPAAPRRRRQRGRRGGRKGPLLHCARHQNHFDVTNFPRNRRKVGILTAACTIERCENIYALRAVDWKNWRAVT